MMVLPLRNYFSCCNRLIIPNDHHAAQSKSSTKKPVHETEASPYFEAQQLRPSSSNDVALGGGF